MPRQTTQQNFTFLGLVAAILNWTHTHTHIEGWIKARGASHMMRTESWLSAH